MITTEEKSQRQYIVISNLIILDKYHVVLTELKS